MPRVMDAEELRMRRTDGVEAAWQANCGPCGDPGCRADHSVEGYLLAIIREETEGSGPVVLLRAHEVRVAPIIGEYPDSIVLLLHGETLTRFLDDVDELRRMLAK